MTIVSKSSSFVFALLLVASLSSAVCAQEIEPGLYLRTTYAFRNLELSTILIGPGHKIAFNPKNGTDAFDFAAATKDPKQKVGTFKIQGDKIIVTWSDGKTETLSVEFDKGQFSAYDGGLITKATAYAKNQKLDATYGGSAMTAHVSSAMTLKFAPDGSYTLSRLGGIRAIPGNTGIAEKSETGTYTLSGNTLSLNPAGGKASRYTVLPFNTALDPAKAKISDDHMIFDSSNLKREK